MGGNDETRSLLRLNDHSRTGLEAALDRAVSLAAAWEAREMPRTLAGARVALIVEERGWRNPVAMALGARAMGAAIETLPQGLFGAEAPEDLGPYLANWFDALAVRAPDIVWLEALADAFPGPVLNLRTRANHPFEVLGDLAFLRSLGRGPAGLRVAVVAPRGNILASWAEAADALGIAVTQVFDADFHLDGPRGGLAATHDMEAIADADVIVTDCWPRHEPPRAFPAFRVTAAILDRCRDDVVFIPCPPVTRGEEVDAAAMRHPRQMAYRAKAFLMHVQLAFLEGALGRDGG
ncbi:MAG: ornithine carbamoyltransferase [Salinarimonadaceae bacterium]|nr:MAG: ornithine carbamoyltransferase [Salinarimonadaceae bacterium]